MPALTRRRVSVRRRRAGRRRTSLEGGNRGMPRGGPGRLNRYGDLMLGSAAGRCDRAAWTDRWHRAEVDVCTAMVESWSTQQTRSHVTGAQGKAVRNRR
jgi:hypothetical protein